MGEAAEDPDVPTIALAGEVEPGLEGPAPKPLRAHFSVCTGAIRLSDETEKERVKLMIGELAKHVILCLSS